MESDETRIYNAAHLMVASLAGSLAHVTCKVYNLRQNFSEPLPFDHCILNDALLLQFHCFSFLSYLCLWIARSPCAVLYQVN